MLEGLISCSCCRHVGPDLNACGTLFPKGQLDTFTRMSHASASWLRLVHTGQGAAEAALPLVVHACSSCTNPTSLRDWWVLGYQYWSANPAPVKLAPGDYPRPDRRRAPALRTGLP